MRICSLLPSGTEILYALGLGDQVCGVSHECDFPPEARAKPVVVRGAILSEGRTSAEIDIKEIMVEHERDVFGSVGLFD